MDEGVVEGSEDASNAKDEFALADLRAQGDVLGGGAVDGLLRRHVGRWIWVLDLEAERFSFAVEWKLKSRVEFRADISPWVT